MTRRILTLSAAFALAAASAQAAPAASLYETYSRKGEVTVHVKTPVDGSGQSRLDPAVFKKQIEEALTGRKSVRFRVVPDPAGAELVVETRIDGYLRTDEDPVDMLVGAAAIAMDAARKEPYVRIEATASVASGGRVLWSAPLTATLTGAEAVEATAPEAVGREFAKEFVSGCFGKKRPR